MNLYSLPKYLSEIKKFLIKIADKRIYYIPLPFILCLIFSLIVLGGHVYHPEAEYSMLNYFQHKPFLYKIFDAEGPFGYNFLAYQAREFSYLTNYLDAYFILLTSALGVAQFYSLTHYISILIIAFIAFVISRRFFGQPFYYIALLISLLYLTSPGPFLSGYNYRTSKILVALFITLINYLVLRYAEQKNRNIKIPFIIIVSTILMATSDKEGFYFAGIFTALSFAILILDRGIKTLNIFFAFVIATFLASYYSHTLGPLIIEHYIGYYPVFTPDASYFSYIGAIGYHFKNALLYLAYEVSYFYGNLGTLAGYFIIFLFGVFYLVIFFLSPRDDDSPYHLPNIKKLTLFIPLLLLAVIPFLTFMFSYSLFFLTMPDLRLIYYNLPLTTLILLFSQLLFSRLLRIMPYLYKLTLIIILIIFILNLFALIPHYKVLLDGHLKVQFASSKYLKKCIIDRNVLEKNFTGLMTQSHDEACVLFRKILGEHVPPAQKDNLGLTACKNEWLVPILMKLQLPAWLH